MKKTSLVIVAVIVVVVAGALWFASRGPAQLSGPFSLSSGGTMLEVRPQKSSEAFRYVLGTLSFMDFFRQNGYDVALPDHELFDASGDDEIVDTAAAALLFETEVYDETEFARALGSLRKDSTSLRAVLDWFAVRRNVNGFRRYATYTVTLTLYGPGGSFDPESGFITLLTTRKGDFKGGGGVHTIAHEMMHLAVEEGLVQRFELSHWEKERLVDLLTRRELAHVLPDYRLQQAGTSDLDSYVEGVALEDLAGSLDEYRRSK